MRAVRRLPLVFLLFLAAAVSAGTGGAVGAESSDDRTDVTKFFTELVGSAESAKQQFGIDWPPTRVEVGQPVRTYQFTRQAAGAPIDGPVTLDELERAGLVDEGEQTAALYADDVPIGTARIAMGSIVAIDSRRDVGSSISRMSVDCCLLELPQVGGEIYLVRGGSATAEPLVSSSAKETVELSAIGLQMSDRLLEVAAAESKGLTGSGFEPLDLPPTGTSRSQAWLILPAAASALLAWVVLRPRMRRSSKASSELP